MEKINIRLDENQIENLANGVPFVTQIVIGFEDNDPAKPIIAEVTIEETWSKPMIQNMLRNKIQLIDVDRQSMINDFSNSMSSSWSK